MRDGKLELGQEVVEREITFQGGSETKTSPDPAA